ncbi:hypothetical protein [Mycoplasma sp. ATU-Cv-508]|uniref:hypothetical protein n=1 Tax=Mycoplasma sp. ATU-Cv-508 TaxID=2048001 RepID=UPI0011E4DCDC
MKKFALTSAYLGLGLLPVASLASCIFESEPVKERKNKTHKSAARQQSYSTIFTNKPVLNFKEGRFYSPAQVGLETILLRSTSLKL